MPSLADKLLDAHVAFVIEEFTGPAFEQSVARDVDDLLSFAATLKLADAVETDTLKTIARRAVGTVGTSPLIAPTAVAISDAIYDLDAADQHKLEELIEDEPVQALIVKVLGMKQLQERAGERVSQSPLISGLVGKFATKLVSDMIAQNRARAEKMPGVGGMVKLSMGAANRMKSPFDKQIDALIGGAADKGAQLAMKTTSNSLKEIVEDPKMVAAIMEVYGLQAAELLSDLRSYLTRQDLHELITLIGAVLADARDSVVTGHLLDAIIDALFAIHGDKTVGTLLDELGVHRDELVDDARRVLPGILEQARANGDLEEQIRKRLAPFYASDAVAELLS